MDTEQKFSKINNTDIHQLPTQLVVGPPAAALAYIVRYLQKHLCIHGGCTICTTCKKITNRNHYALTWIAPHERYTLEDLAPVMQTLALQPDEGQRHYIIIEQSDSLTSLCANALLKTIEEPPRGYHIILVAQIIDRILPTVRSRCLVIHVHGAQSTAKHPLVSYFTQESLPELSMFMKFIENNKLTEQENFDVLDAILSALLATIREQYATTQSPSALCMHRYTLLRHICERALMPGSAKIIWRELYLQWNKNH